MCKRCNICQNIYVYIYICVKDMFLYLYIYMSKICFCIYIYVKIFIDSFICIYIIIYMYVYKSFVGSMSFQFPVHWICQMGGDLLPHQNRILSSCSRAFSSEKWPLKLFCWRRWRGCFKPRGRMSSKRKPCFFADCNFFYWKEMDSSNPYFPIHQQSRKHTRSPIFKIFENGVS